MKTRFLRVFELFPRLDLFRKQTKALVAVGFGQKQNVFPRDLFDIHGEEVGKVDDRFPRIPDRELVEGNFVAGTLQFPASLFDCIIRQHFASDLRDHLVCRKKCEVLLEKNVPRALDECKPVVA